MFINRLLRTACVLSVFTSFAGQLVAEPEVLDGIAAVVNKEVVTFSQVREMVAPRERALRQAYSGADLEAKVKLLRENALQELIDRQLILQDFKKNDFKLPPYVIEEHIKTIIREEFGGDRGAFIRTLQAQGYTLSKFKEMEMNKIIVQAMRGQKVKSNLAIPPTKVRDYYDSHRQEFAANESVQLRMIVIPKQSPDGGSATAQKELVSEIRAKIKNGADFAKMAQLYSQDSSADVGGEWGWIDKKTLNPALTEAAFALKPGEVGPVFEQASNYYLMKVEARKEPTYAPFDTVKKDIEAKLLGEERQKASEKWLIELRNKAYIKRF
ncbi:MAG: peptidyl-prolyl cis-trans isomerase [Chthoniobacterales bacterium]